MLASHPAQMMNHKTHSKGIFRFNQTQNCSRFLMEVSEFADDFLQSLKSHSVFNFDDVGS